jgi:hypothetical protein
MQSAVSAGISSVSVGTILSCSPLLRVFFGFQEARSLVSILCHVLFPSSPFLTHSRLSTLLNDSQLIHTAFPHSHLNPFICYLCLTPFAVSCFSVSCESFFLIVPFAILLSAFLCGAQSSEAYCTALNHFQGRKVLDYIVRRKPCKKPF